MRFDRSSAFHDSLNRFHLIHWNGGWLPSAGHKAMYPGGGQYMDTPLEAPLDKYVAWKQRQGEHLGPVLPSVSGCVKRKKRLKSFIGEILSDHFLVLMASVIAYHGDSQGWQSSEYIGSESM